LPTLDVDGARLSFIDEGRGPTVVLLHAGASSARQWDRLIGRLRGRYRVLAPDFRGQGETAKWMARRPLSFADEWKLVEAMFRLSQGPVHLIAHSYGGWVALDGALLAAGLLSSLTLIEPSAFHLLRDDGAPGLYEEIHTLCEAHVDLVGRGKLLDAAERSISYWFGADTWQRMGEDRRAAVAALMETHTMGFAAIFRPRIPLDEYRRITAPTLLMRGTETVAPSRRVVELLLRTLPDNRLVEVPGAGHTLPMSHAEVVNAEIEAHLASQPED
jgi:pimeloyl-ACP methyl ester carboxylesterase